MSRLGPFIIGGAGLLCLAVGIVLLLIELSFGRRAQRAQGTVIAAMMPPGKSSSPGMHVPVVEFKVDGRSRTVQGRSPARDWGRRIGEPLPVLYDPADPDNAAVDDGIARYSASGAWMLFGVAIVAGAVFLKVRQG